MLIADLISAFEETSYYGLEVNYYHESKENHFIYIILYLYIYLSTIQKNCILLITHLH